MIKDPLRVTGYLCGELSVFKSLNFVVSIIPDLW